MTDYISREAANIAIQKKMQEYINKSVQPLGFGRYREDDLFTNAALGCRAALEEVKAIPAADVREVKRGKWDDKKVAFYFKCSECGCCVRAFAGEVFLDYAQEWNFCPNCGSDNREEQT